MVRTVPMKHHYPLSLLLLLSCTCAAKPFSIEQFRKTASAEEREKIIEQAPPEQRDELEKIDNHLMLLAYDKKKGIQGDKESAIAQARGFQDLENLFMGWANEWLFHAGEIIQANRQSGMNHEKQLEIEKRLNEKINALAARQREVHDLVFHLAASPLALDVERKAEELDGKISARTSPSSIDSSQTPITNEERSVWDQHLNLLFKKMKRLPTLTPERLQQEYDAFPEAKIYEKSKHSNLQENPGRTRPAFCSQ